MKFRDEEVTAVFIKSGSDSEIKKFIFSIGKLNTIIDLQYGYYLDKDLREWHSVLILAKCK